MPHSATVKRPNLHARGPQIQISVSESVVSDSIPAAPTLQSVLPERDANQKSPGVHALGGGSFGRALGLGVVAGLRTATAPASLSRAYRRGILPLQEGGLLGLPTKRGMARFLTVNALGEMVVDKMPWVPSRVQPVALVPRLASGASVGTAIYRGAGRRFWIGA